MADYTEAYLAHYGVPGMKWGKSSSRSSKSGPSRSEKRAALKVPNAKYGAQARAIDKATLGTLGVKAVNKRMNKGQTHKKAASTVFAKQAAGALVVSGLLLAPQIAAGQMNKPAHQQSQARGKSKLKALGTGYDTIKLKPGKDGVWG